MINTPSFQNTNQTPTRTFTTPATSLTTATPSSSISSLLMSLPFNNSSNFYLPINPTNSKNNHNMLIQQLNNNLNNPTQSQANLASQSNLNNSQNNLNFLANSNTNNQFPGMNISGFPCLQEQLQNGISEQNMLQLYSINMQYQQIIQQQQHQLKQMQHLQQNQQLNQMYSPLNVGNQIPFGNINNSLLMLQNSLHNPQILSYPQQTGGLISSIKQETIGTTSTSQLSFQPGNPINSAFSIPCDKRSTSLSKLEEDIPCDSSLKTIQLPVCDNSSFNAKRKASSDTHESLQQSEMETLTKKRLILVKQEDQFNTNNQTDHHQEQDCEQNNNDNKSMPENEETDRNNKTKSDQSTRETSILQKNEYHSAQNLWDEDCSNNNNGDNSKIRKSCYTSRMTLTQPFSLSTQQKINFNSNSSFSWQNSWEEFNKVSSLEKISEASQCFDRFLERVSVSEGVSIVMENMPLNAEELSGFESRFVNSMKARQSKDKRNPNALYMTRFHNLTRLLMYNIVQLFSYETLGSQLQLHFYLAQELETICRKIKQHARQTCNGQFKTDFYTHSHYNGLFLVLDNSTLPHVSKSQKDIEIHQLVYEIDLIPSQNQPQEQKFLIKKANFFKALAHKILLLCSKSTENKDPNNSSAVQSPPGDDARRIYFRRALSGIAKLSTGTIVHRF